MITKFINFKIFIISLTIGLFIAYLSNEQPNIIYVFPTPDNYDKIVYKDKVSNCFKFDVNEVQCPIDEKLISSIPAQY